MRRRRRANAGCAPASRARAACAGCAATPSPARRMASSGAERFDAPPPRSICRRVHRRPVGANYAASADEHGARRVGIRRRRAAAASSDGARVARRRLARAAREASARAVPISAAEEELVSATRLPASARRTVLVPPRVGRGVASASSPSAALAQLLAGRAARAAPPRHRAVAAPPQLGARRVAVVRRAPRRRSLEELASAARSKAIAWAAASGRASSPGGARRRERPSAAFTSGGDALLRFPLRRTRVALAPDSAAPTATAAPVPCNAVAARPPFGSLGGVARERRNGEDGARRARQWHAGLRSPPPALLRRPSPVRLGRATPPRRRRPRRAHYRPGHTMRTSAERGPRPAALAASRTGARSFSGQNCGSRRAAAWRRRRGPPASPGRAPSRRRFSPPRRRRRAAEHRRPRCGPDDAASARAPVQSGIRGNARRRAVGERALHGGQIAELGRLEEERGGRGGVGLRAGRHGEDKLV